MPSCCHALQDEAFRAFSDNIKAIGEEKQALQQAVHDAKRQLNKVQVQIKTTDGEIASIRQLRAGTLEALQKAEEKLAVSSQVPSVICTCTAG